MTLVLPGYIGEQLTPSALFATASAGSGTAPMPCVFDGEPLDFESALMTDWSADIADYDVPGEEPSAKAPSGSSEKRKAPASLDDGLPGSVEPKRLRTGEPIPPTSPPPPAFVPPQQQQPVSPSGRAALPPSPLATARPVAPALSEDEDEPPEDDDEEEEEDEEEEDEPRRRRRLAPLWPSRQRWKDERKRILRLAVAKLTDIEDPELCLLRSVLLNNTVKRLHTDIRSERQAKLRHRQQQQQQQRVDYFAQAPPDATPKQQQQGDVYDDTSCDEIFGISEDFLRVNIPDRRVSSPIPTTTDSGGKPTPPPPQFRPRTPEPQRRVGGQCATQFRTSDCGGGDGTFPPRVPILDSVVYHSLLASLESS